MAPRVALNDIDSRSDAAYESAELQRVVAALAHPARRYALTLLEFGGTDAGDLTECLAAEFGIAHSTASHHLNVLARARLVVVSADGPVRYYAIAEAAARPLAAWLAALRID